MFAVSLALLAQAFEPGRERGEAIGVYGATIGVAFAIGPLVGGALTDALDWQWIFFLNVPIGDRGIVITLHEAARDARPQRARGSTGPASSRSRAPLFLLVLALLRGNDEGWGSDADRRRCSRRAGVLLAAFVAIEPRVERADAPAAPVPQARLHRRADRRRSRSRRRCSRCSST